MKNNLLLVFFLFSFLCSFSQTNVKTQEHQQYQEDLRNKVLTLNLDVASYDMNLLGELKDELLTFDGKVISVLLDEVNRTMKITHNALLSKEEAMQILTKHHILSTAIVSYQ
jgi:hypothetical protein